MKFSETPPLSAIVGLVGVVLLMGRAWNQAPEVARVLSIVFLSCFAVAVALDVARYAWLVARKWMP